MLGGGVVMAGTFLLLTLYLQLVEGLSPLQAGLWLVPLNVAMAGQHDARAAAGPAVPRRRP